MTQVFNDTKSILTDTEHRMQKALDVARHEFQSMRTGRASVALVENIQVEYYGSKIHLKGLATINTPDAKTIAIQPWDANAVSAIEKAISSSGLGLTPASDGHILRIQIPPLTEERKREMDKLVRKVAEDGRVAIRNIRHEANESVKKIEKSKVIGEDISKATQKKVQDLTDKFVKLVDEALEKKELELK